MYTCGEHDLVWGLTISAWIRPELIRIGALGVGEWIFEIRPSNPWRSSSSNNTKKHTFMLFRQMGNSFILQQWKLNSYTYPVLSEVTRQVLAVLISTVSSETCFGYGWKEMGNGLTSLDKCFAVEASRRYDVAVICSDKMIDEGFGHSFCYIRPEYQCNLPSSKVYSEESYRTTTFRSISGASVSANTFTPLSTSLVDLYSYSGFSDKASAFESSISFASVPLQPVPKSANLNYYNNLSPGKIRGFPGSGPIEKGFLSGPIERGFASGPIERGLYSGPMDKVSDHNQNQVVELQKSFSNKAERGGLRSETSKCKKKKFFSFVKTVVSRTLSKGRKSAVVEQVLESDCVGGLERNRETITGSSSNYLSSCVSLSEEEDGDESRKSQHLQWAEGKAGEDRVHIVISDENGWVFVGIYDGFNGPDAPDYLLSNLYAAVHKELEGLLWNAKFESDLDSDKAHDHSQLKTNPTKTSNLNFDSKTNQNRTLKNQLSGSNRVPSVDHSDVLKALSQALMKTEEAYLEVADKMVKENPELALMGSCVLVMLMKGEDVYVMNVGDSRAVLAQQPETELVQGQGGQVNNESQDEEEAFDGYESDQTPVLTSLQLTVDHSTNIEEEAERIRREHPDDALAISKDRVKGSLKVTRAFGAGFLKQPKWNNALLETFRIHYIGNSPYISCSPSLYHHRLGPRDNFLILSSDGLYQYFTNQEAVSQVELFMDTFPEGDPAQHLIEEVLFRAAKKAGMDFHDLLDIPQGDRRRYHDDVSIIIISLEGRIWRSSV